LDDEDGNVGAFEEAGFVRADELIGCGFGEGAAEKRDGRALRSLRVDDQFAGNRSGDEGSVGGSLDLLDGVDGGGRDDRRAVLFDGRDGAGDGCRVDERANSVVDEDDVFIARRRKLGEGVGDGLLAIVAADDDVDFGSQAVLGEHGGDARLLGVANGDVDRGDGGDVQKGAQRVDQDGKAPEQEKLL